MQYRFVGNSRDCYFRFERECLSFDEVLSVIKRGKRGYRTTGGVFITRRVRYVLDEAGTKVWPPKDQINKAASSGESMNGTFSSGTSETGL